MRRRRLVLAIFRANSRLGIYIIIPPPPLSYHVLYLMHILYFIFYILLNFHLLIFFDVMELHFTLLSLLIFA